MADQSINGSGFGDGSGNWDGSGSGDGFGDGSGSGYGSGIGYGSRSGSGDGNGSGDGSGIGSSERLKIELNILSHIPDLDLPLFIGKWEFKETQVLFEKRLKG
jgi:hypothetical protein